MCFIIKNENKRVFNEVNQLMNQSIITQTGKKVLRAYFALQNLNRVSIDVLCF